MTGQQAEKEYQEAKKHLRAFFLAVAERKIDSEIARGIPDIADRLSYLASLRMYDGCKNLIAVFEAYLEAQVNLMLANQHEATTTRWTEYNKVVGADSADPEYLRPEE